MKTQKPHQNKLMKIITIPIRALAKARDFYVRSMNNYADKISYSGGPSYVDNLPRSFSNTSARSNESNDDFKELVRAASTSKLANRIDLSHPAFSSAGLPNSNNDVNNSSFQLGKEWQGGKIKRGTVPRSSSVGMGKIEEDKPVEFSEIGNIGLNQVGVDNNHKKSDSNNGSVIKEKFRFFPRSKSYAVGSTKRTHLAVF